MDYGAALSAIEASGTANAADIVAAIKGQIATVLNEKRAAIGNSSALVSNAEAILAAIGAAGDDPAARFADAAGKLTSLQATLATTQAQSKTLSEANEQLLGQVATLGRTATVSQVVAITGAVPAVLEALVPDHSKITIADGKVTIGGTAWDDWIKDSAVQPFVPALLPAAGGAGGGGGGGGGKPKLPTAAAADDGGEREMASVYDRVRGLNKPGQQTTQAQNAAPQISPWMR